MDGFVDDQVVLSPTLAEDYVIKDNEWTSAAITISLNSKSKSSSVWAEVTENAEETVAVKVLSIDTGAGVVEMPGGISNLFTIILYHTISTIIVCTSGGGGEGGGEFIYDAVRCDSTRARARSILSCCLSDVRSPCERYSTHSKSIGSCFFMLESVALRAPRGRVLTHDHTVSYFACSSTAGTSSIIYLIHQRPRRRPHRTASAF